LDANAATLSELSAGMRVLVTGGYGLIGSAILSQLHRDGHAVVGAGRSIGEARRRFPYAQWVEADFARLREPDAWRPLLAGVDAVVNCVGVLQDGARDDTRNVHVEATCALFDACARAGIRRVLHVSAIGSDSAGPTEFARTKAEADAHLARLDLDWIILRPGIVLGPAAHGGSAMIRGLAGLPLVTPVVYADSWIQVIGSNDIARTVAFCLDPTAPSKVTWDLVHPQAHRLADIVAATRQWLGLPPRRAIEVPGAVARLIARFADGLGWLGWRSPARSTALAQLAHGVTGNPAAWMAATGRTPQSLADILAVAPATVADRWYARLYWLKPAAIAALALFWIATGAIALGPGRAAALNQLVQGGFPPGVAESVLVGGSAVDIVLGLLLLVRRFARFALWTMLAVAGIYLVVGTVAAPHLWFDPLGPYAKIVPVLVATAFTLAILDER
jgi:uncharacterized protein YbjT (DUF2867 family)